MQIDGDDGVKVGYVDRTMKREMLDAFNLEESQGGFFGGKSKKVKEKELKEMSLIYSHNFPKEDSEPNAAGMHGSMTMLGIQPSVVVGTKGGGVYKWNNVEAKGEQQVRLDKSGRGGGGREGVGGKEVNKKTREGRASGLINKGDHPLLTSILIIIIPYPSSISLPNSRFPPSLLASKRRRHNNRRQGSPRFKSRRRRAR